MCKGRKEGEEGGGKREEKRREQKRVGRRGEENGACERTERVEALSLSLSPFLSRSAVIYRPEPSPSLTPLLRNYTQSVANKSKKVLAVLVRIHETCARVSSAPRPILLHLLPTLLLSSLSSTTAFHHLIPSPSSRFARRKACEPPQPIRSRFWSR